LSSAAKRASLLLDPISNSLRARHSKVSWFLPSFTALERGRRRREKVEEEGKEKEKEGEKRRRGQLRGARLRAWCDLHLPLHLPPSRTPRPLTFMTTCSTYGSP